MVRYLVKIWHISSKEVGTDSLMGCTIARASVMPADALDIALVRIGSSSGTVVLGYIAAEATLPGIAPPRSTDADDEIDDAEARIITRIGLDADRLGILLANLLGLEVPGASQKAGRGSQCIFARNGSSRVAGRSRCAPPLRSHMLRLSNRVDVSFHDPSAWESS